MQTVSFQIDETNTDFVAAVDARYTGRRNEAVGEWLVMKLVVPQLNALHYAALQQKATRGEDIQGSPASAVVIP